jgi:hypothetical protein
VCVGEGKGQKIKAMCCVKRGRKKKGRARRGGERQGRAGRERGCVCVERHGKENVCLDKAWREKLCV